ncbi:hypothetical protein VTK73DRAFT_9990 [Phialemonium thermophilum]|uniref:WW domain-containing protein n=1 Tax=Phialemonium thermophilum TaxID=223376 RepID=A0ABR3Y4W2_9PEZI
MSDFEAPPGPPPPKVPEGWVARWNDQYKEWFYVNTFTKKSQWEKPTAPARPPDDEAPPGPPPSYSPGAGPTPNDTKKNPYADNSHDRSSGGPSSIEDEDAKLARQLQAEEDARARAHGGLGSGAASSYASTPVPGDSPYPNQLPPRPGSESNDKSRGLLGKIFGKNKQSGSAPYSQSAAYPTQGYGASSPYSAPPAGYSPPPPGPAYGGYAPPNPYGGYPPQPGYGGYPPQGGYYAAPQQAYGRPAKSGGGMGAMGGAALGLGAGLIGGALITDAIEDGQHDAYQEGYQDGADDGGGDFGGDGGGDF